MQNKQPKFIYAVLGIAIFLISGLVFIIVAYTEYKNYGDFKKIANETEATITHIKTYEESRGGDWVTMHDAYVSFFVNGIEYSGKLDNYSWGMREGGTTEILYHPDNPQNFRSSNGMFTRMFVAGLISLIMGIGFIVLIRINPYLHNEYK